MRIDLRDSFFFTTFAPINLLIMNIRSYIVENRTRFVEEWASLIRIPSVSCQPAHKDDMLRCAERWCELLLEAGVQRADIVVNNDGTIPILTLCEDIIQQLTE